MVSWEKNPLIDPDKAFLRTFGAEPALFVNGERIRFNRSLTLPFITCITLNFGEVCIDTVIEDILPDYIEDPDSYMRQLKLDANAHLEPFFHEPFITYHRQVYHIRTDLIISDYDLWVSEQLPLFYYYQKFMPKHNWAREYDYIVDDIYYRLSNPNPAPEKEEKKPKDRYHLR